MHLNIVEIKLKCNFIEETKNGAKRHLSENECQKLLTKMLERKNDLVDIFVKYGCTKTFKISLLNFKDGPGYEIFCHCASNIFVRIFLTELKNKVRNKLKEFVKASATDSIVSYQVTLDTVETREQLLTKAENFFL